MNQKPFVVRGEMF